MVEFLKRSDRTKALQEAPWFMGRRFTYCFPWHLEFNINIEFISEFPVWIELPFRDIILEPSCRDLISTIGRILHYTHGDIMSEYPNDRACILWDLRKKVPKRLKIVYKHAIIWQLVEFRNIPVSCSGCKSHTHLAFACSLLNRQIVVGHPPIDTDFAMPPPRENNLPSHNPTKFRNQDQLLQYNPTIQVRLLQHQ
jgi:hypothetical protein